jgi:hypothetical protein
MENLKKELEDMKRLVELQEKRLAELSKIRDEEHLSQVFLTREEYPKLEDIKYKLSGFEKKLAKTESALRKKLDVLEAEAVEQRRLIERMGRRKKAASIPGLPAVMRLLSATFVPKKRTVNKKR